MVSPVPICVQFGPRGGFALGSRVLGLCGISTQGVRRRRTLLLPAMFSTWLLQQSGGEQRYKTRELVP